MAAATAPTVDDVIDMLRGAGERITTAKRALVAAVLSADGHRTADQLIATVQKRHPDVNKSTIYRILHSLEERGIVEHVHLGHGPAVYHLADHAHHHLVCDACGRIEEIPDEVLAAMIRSLENKFGFIADSRHFAISGRCRTC
jgi:Fur family ferric uptake transcriptional regulator